jgi:hypothetical protein
MQQMQQAYGNRAVQQFFQREATAISPVSSSSTLVPVQRHADRQAEAEFKEGAQPELDEQARQAASDVMAQGQGREEDKESSVQMVRVSESSLAVQRVPIGVFVVQRDKKKSSLDKDTQAIVDYAQDATIPIQERAKNTVQKILDKYYSADKSNVNKVEYVAGDPGLTTSWDPPASDPKPYLKVGDDFVNNTTEAHFSRKVLQVGHEIKHVRQFKAKVPGLGPKFMHEREFLAFYWEATAPTVAGTGGDMSHKMRVDLIDAALGHLCCLPAGSYSAEKKTLLSLRAQHDGVDRSGKKTLPTTSPPTTCPG